MFYHIIFIIIIVIIVMLNKCGECQNVLICNHRQVDCGFLFVNELKSDLRVIANYRSKCFDALIFC